MREIVHLQAGQCGNQIGSKVLNDLLKNIVSKGFGWLWLRGEDKMDVYHENMRYSQLCEHFVVKFFLTLMVFNKILWILFFRLLFRTKLIELEVMSLFFSEHFIIILLVL